MLWADYRRPTVEELNELGRRNRPTSYTASAGIKIQDKLRSSVAEGAAMNRFEYLRSLPTHSIQSDQDTTWLHEILEMLLDDAKAH